MKKGHEFEREQGECRRGFGRKKEKNKTTATKNQTRLIFRLEVRPEIAPRSKSEDPEL